MTIGFIGTGVIASCLVTGFCREDRRWQGIVSPRNEAKAAALAAAFPGQVTIAGDNQQVADAAEWVFLCLPPEPAEGIIRGLRFRPGHKVVSLLADKPLAVVREWLGPAGLVVRAVPMSFNAKGLGPIVLYPPQPQAAELLAPLGQVTPVGEEGEFQVLQAYTALQASFYTLLRELVDWGEAGGARREDCLAYLAAMFQAFTREIAGADHAELDRLSRQMTPGGLNHMVLTQLGQSGALEQWPQALEQVLGRLRRQYMADKGGPGGPKEGVL